WLPLRRSPHLSRRGSLLRPRPPSWPISPPSSNGSPTSRRRTPTCAAGWPRSSTNCRTSADAVNAPPSAVTRPRRRAPIADAGRTRLLTCNSPAHLGISLGNTRDLLHDSCGLTISRPGLLSHLRWGGQLFAPVVDELLELLHQSPVGQGDETGWRSDGRPAW